LAVKVATEVSDEQGWKSFPAIPGARNTAGGRPGRDTQFTSNEVDELKKETEEEKKKEKKVNNETLTTFCENCDKLIKPLASRNQGSWMLLVYRNPALSLFTFFSFFFSSSVSSKQKVKLIYIYMKLDAWIAKNFEVSSVQGQELQFPCPKCGFEKFYFNTSKKVGYCHRVSCHYKPGLKELSKKARTKWNGLGDAQIEAPKAKKAVILPAEARPLVDRLDGELVTEFHDVVDYVAGRGVSPAKQFQFKLHWDGTYVYIPVYFEGKLVNYVGRVAWWVDTGLKRYAYATGASTRDYLFNWDTAKLWSNLVLVENTFNGIWLSEHCYATTNFGSDLSLTQVELIAKSKVKKVVLLWDEGAEWSAGRARGRLIEAGVSATILKIKGQPDDHAIGDLMPWIDYALLNPENKAIIETYDE
jgi:hypothetical protein